MCIVIHFKRLFLSVIFGIMFASDVSSVVYVVYFAETYISKKKSSNATYSLRLNFPITGLMGIFKRFLIKVHVVEQIWEI